MYFLKRLKSFPDWMRGSLNDGNRFLVLCIMAGLFCGITAVAFHYAIHGLFEWLWNTAIHKDPVRFCAMMIAGPTLGGLAVGIAVRLYSPEIAGSGIPQTKVAYYNHGGNIRARTGVLRFILGSLYVGLGNSLGREGPTVHLSAAICSRLGRWAFRKPERVQAMLPVGMAAGIAAAFNAPLSALTFVFEELLDNFSKKALGGMVVSVVIAAAVSRTMLGEEPVISARAIGDYETSTWMLVAIPMGVAAGLIGHLFVRSTLGLRGTLRKNRMVPSWLTPAIGGLSCGIIGLLCFWLTRMLGDARSSIFSIGYDSLVAAFSVKLSVGIIAVLLVGKFIVVVINYATGGSGGLFSPTLFLGGMLGGLIGMGLASIEHSWPWIPQFPDDSKVIAGCVLIGMGAMFAAVVRCRFTSLIIIFEMTGNYSLILPLMAGNIIAWEIARRLQHIPLYDALLIQDGISLRKLPSFRGDKDYRNLPVQAIMTHEVFELLGTLSCKQALTILHKHHACYHAYPVVDADDKLLGMVSLHEVETSDPESSLMTLLDGQELLAVYPHTAIRDAAVRMIERNLQQVPVVCEAYPDKLLGLLTLNDIARQQNTL